MVAHSSRRINTLVSPQQRLGNKVHEIKRSVRGYQKIIPIAVEHCLLNAVEVLSRIADEVNVNPERFCKGGLNRIFRSNRCEQSPTALHLAKNNNKIRLGISSSQRGNGIAHHTIRFALTKENALLEISGFPLTFESSFLQPTVLTMHKLGSVR